MDGLQTSLIEGVTLSAPVDHERQPPLRAVCQRAHERPEYIASEEILAGVRVVGCLVAMDTMTIRDPGYHLSNRRRVHRDDEERNGLPWQYSPNSSI